MERPASFSLCALHYLPCTGPAPGITTTGTQAVVQWTTANPTAQFIIEYGPSGFSP
ncbi:MAG: hypothetical protein IPJ10_17355 [Flavobacteriales bacterium]|nr:hypothetical protein [Flavobacteriales bacterium]